MGLYSKKKRKKERKTRSVDRIHVDGAVLAVVVVVKYTRDPGRGHGFIQPFEKGKSLDCLSGMPLRASPLKGSKGTVAALNSGVPWPSLGRL